MKLQGLNFGKNFNNALKVTVVLSILSFFINFKYPYTLTYFLQDARSFLLLLGSIFLVDVLFDGIVNWFKNR